MAPLALLVLGAAAQAAEPLTLRQALEAALARLPELQAAPQRRDAAAAMARAARAWTPEPAAFETSFKTDGPGSQRGGRELAAGLAVPLWLPGQRAGTQALALAEQAALDAQLPAARLRAAGHVREAWWALHGAREDEALAQARQDHARDLVADVARRVQAGDLARADQHQAEGLLAAAQAERAAAQAARLREAAVLRGLAGRLDTEAAQAVPEPPPAALDAAGLAAALAAHPVLQALQARVAMAQRGGELARLQARAAPELALAATRERGAAGEAYGQTVSIGLRIPFGQDDRQQARLAAAGADETEARSQLAGERERIADEIEHAQAGVALVREAATAAARRATLARESQGFQDKAFRLGQSDLPTRLRSALEAFEAQRHGARAGIALALAISQWRQALGLLPE